MRTPGLVRSIDVPPPRWYTTKSRCKLVSGAGGLRAFRVVEFGDGGRLRFLRRDHKNQKSRRDAGATKTEASRGHGNGLGLTLSSLWNALGAQPFVDR